MNTVIREVRTDDWCAIYLNEKLVFEDHSVDIHAICDELQDLITHNGNITSINSECYFLNDEYAEEYGIPDKFSDIPEDMLG